MSAQYWVLCSDDLMAQPGLRLPDGLHIASAPVARRATTSDPAWEPGASWYRFVDDNAPVELEGVKVELILRLEDGVPVIAERRVLS